MPRTPKSSLKTTTQPVKSPALLLTFTALDTTWRTLVPGIAGVFLGIYLDHKWDTMPLVTITLLAVGIALSAYLIYRQFKGIGR